MSENTSGNTAKEEVQSTGSSLPLVLSGIAVLLAALALIANQMGQPEPRMDPLDAVNSKLGQIEARIGDMESQLTNDKLDVVNMRLKRILLDLEQLSTVADDATRSKINQAYQLLEPLTGPATKVKAEVDVQSTIALENQSQSEEPTTPSPEENTSAEPIKPETEMPLSFEPSPAEEKIIVEEPSSSTEPESGVIPEQTPDPSAILQPDMSPSKDKPNTPPSGEGSAIHF